MVYYYRTSKSIIKTIANNYQLIVKKMDAMRDDPELDPDDIVCETYNGYIMIGNFPYNHESETPLCPQYFVIDFWAAIQDISKGSLLEIENEIGKDFLHIIKCDIDDFDWKHDEFTVDLSNIKVFIKNPHSKRECVLIVDDLTISAFSYDIYFDTLLKKVYDLDEL